MTITIAIITALAAVAAAQWLWHDTAKGSRSYTHRRGEIYAHWITQESPLTARGRSRRAHRKVCPTSARPANGACTSTAHTPPASIAAP